MTVATSIALDTFVFPVLPVAAAALLGRVLKSAGETIATVALSAGIATAHLIVVGIPELPPVDAVGWIPLATVAATPAMFAGKHHLACLAFVFALTTLTTRLLGEPVPIAVGWGAVAAVVSLARISFLALSFALAGGSLGLFFGHSARLAQVLAATAAVVGTAGLVLPPPRAAASIVVVSGTAIAAYAHLYL